jgi:hypothetical protein
MKATDLSTHIIQTTAGMAALRVEWQAAAAAAVPISLFTTWDYLHLVWKWKHAHQSRDAPYLIVIRQAGRLVGLLPLVCSHRSHGGVAMQVLRHMATWEGGRADLLALIAPERLWPAVFEALRRDRHGWHILDLRGLDESDGLLTHLHHVARGFRCEVMPDGVSGYLPLKGSWETYLAARPRGVRQAFLRRQRAMARDYPQACVEVADSPVAISAAFERFLALERRSRKHAVGASLAGSPRRVAFYRAALPLLAAQHKASIWLYHDVSAKTDMAGLVRLSYRDVLYERDSTFDPAYARYAPGTALCAEAMRRSFGGRWRESHVPSRSMPLDEPPTVPAWYDQRRTTCRLVVRNSRFLSWSFIGVSMPVWKF